MWRKERRSVNGRDEVENDGWDKMETNENNYKAKQRIKVKGNG